MENCNHNSHHNDCCVCWWKQANGMEYENDTTMYMHKMMTILSGKTWKDYCMNRALKESKDAVISIMGE